MFEVLFPGALENVTVFVIVNSLPVFFVVIEPSDIFLSIFEG